MTIHFDPTSAGHRNRSRRKTADITSTGSSVRAPFGMHQRAAIMHALTQIGRRPSVDTVPDNFLGIHPPHCDYESARFAVLPIPYDSTTSFQVGARNGPRAIITASQQVEWFDAELGRELHEVGVATLDPIAPEMSGPHAQHEAIYEAATAPVRDGKFLIGLGGEHSITSGLVRAVKDRYHDVSVLQIDAHADLRAEYEGTPWSHASVMRRIVEMDVPIAQVGVRSMPLEEHRFIQEKKICCVTAAEIMTGGSDWMPRVLSALSPHVFVTIDIDGFDPAIAPGTGTPEPGGLDWYTVTRLIRTVAENRILVGADVVEVMPLPGTMHTEFLAAKLMCKLIAYTQLPPG
jgi:agmatinase